MTTETVPQAIDYTPLGFFENTYLVAKTSPGGGLLPVTLAISSRRGGFTVHDYLTANEADRLADALKAMAARVRAET